MNFTDMEYTNRRVTTRREEFLKKMDEILPWDEWCEEIKPFYPDGRRGRKPHPLPQMLRMFMIRSWFGLSDTQTENAVYDSYSMKNFLGLYFSTNEQVPDATTLYKFRRILKAHGLDEKFIAAAHAAAKAEGYRFIKSSMTEIRKYKK